MEYEKRWREIVSRSGDQTRTLGMKEPRIRVTPDLETEAAIEDLIATVKAMSGARIRRSDCVAYFVVLGVRAWRKNRNNGKAEETKIMEWEIVKEEKPDPVMEMLRGGNRE
jgi:hypothetical protein